MERIAARISVFGLGADVIAGFPGETDADHAAPSRSSSRLPFTYLHVFPYSVRPGTAAERLPMAMSPAMARERATELRAIAERKAGAHARVSRRRRDGRRRHGRRRSRAKG